MGQPTHTHTHTRLTALCPGLPGQRKVPERKVPISILLKQETVRDSGISWAMCKPAPCSRQGNHKNAILVQKTTPEINKAHQPIRPKWPETNNLSAKPSFVIISNYKKLGYCRGTARCVVSIEILPIATQQCRNYLYDKSWPNRWYEVGDLVGGNAW